jgi:hypothetical protein
MSGKALAEAERVSLNLILEDLRYLFDKEEVTRDEIDNVLRNLKSEEVKSYLQNLRYGSKPETALRESFIAGKSVLLKYLFGEAVPEVRSNGFIDYLIKDEMGRGIALELKPLFEAEVELDKAGKPILKRMRQKRIKPEDHREQILKYIQEGEAQFVVLTNLKDWFFYSKVLTPREVKPFCSIDFFGFMKEYDVIGNLRDYLERKEFESIRYELDKWFLESLKTWVKKLSEVEFTVDDRRKLELIIGLVNKFIFVQTLDDYGVIEFNWIKKRWNYHEQMWQRKGKLMVLEKFFDELDDWFYLYYDTELFKEKILPYVKQDDENVDKLYRNLQLVLGLTYLQVPFGALKGIMQYNFRYIDEDVLGKAYETFLGEVRKERGVFYTHRYVTQYIAENAVGEIFSQLIAEVKAALDEKDLENAKKRVDKFTSIRVLDPACGSGSFLIKAFRIIVNKYKEVIQLIENFEKSYVKKHSNYLSSLDPPKEVKAVLELISEIKKLIGPSNGRELISKCLVRHIYGNDLDRRALEVAKVNIWLEAIKLSPKEFRYDRLPAYTNYILPNLEINLRNGDTLVGLPEEFTINYLKENHRENLAKVSDLRQRYLENPMNPKLVEEIEKLKAKIKNDLDKKFEDYLKTNEISAQVINHTNPLHWALDFWYCFFNEKGDELSKEMQGFDCVIGNPPYERAILLTDFAKYFSNQFTVAYGAYDIYILFMEKALKLLKNFGILGFIVSNKYLVADYGVKIRNFLMDHCYVKQLIDLTECPSVFEEALISPVITICQKLPNSLDRSTLHTKISIIKKNDPTMIQRISEVHENMTAAGFSVEFREFLKLKDTITGHFNIYLSGIVEEIMEKLYKSSKLLKEISDIRTGIMGFEYWNMEPLVYDDKSTQMNGDVVRLLPPSLIDRYQILWGTEEVDIYKKRFKFPKLRDDPEKINRNTWNLFLKPKIVVRGVARRLSAAYDDTGGYGILVATHSIIPHSEYRPEFLLGLLNSTLFNWIHLIRLYSARIPQGSLRYPISFLEQLPIFPASKSHQESMKKFVDHLLILKRARYAMLEIWKEYSIQLKNYQSSLEQILANDGNSLRSGRFEESWTSKVSFYPDAEADLLEKEFDKFMVIANDRESTLQIFGLDEKGSHELTYEMKFNGKELLKHIYIAMMLTLTSRLKINKLSQLFAKTIVPIIRAVNKSPSELTPNIVKKSENEFEKWLEREEITGIEANIVSIDNGIECMETEIDALTFRLYELTEDQINAVFNSVRTPTLYREKVLGTFRKT